jgi:hypothetical protein
VAIAHDAPDAGGAAARSGRRPECWPRAGIGHQNCGRLARHTGHGRPSERTCPGYSNACRSVRRHTNGRASSHHGCRPGSGHPCSGAARRDAGRTAGSQANVVPAACTAVGPEALMPIVPPVADTAVGPVAATPTVLPSAATAVTPGKLTPTVSPLAARAVALTAATPVPVPPEALRPIPLALIAYTPQPDPA